MISFIIPTYNSQDTIKECLESILKQDVKKDRLIKNVRNYKVGIVPNELSKKDGNGNIVLLTCACDINGTVDDARLDFDVFGWAENGSVYSINQGSIGTFKPGKKDEEQREKLTKHYGTILRMEQLQFYFILMIR